MKNVLDILAAGQVRCSACDGLRHRCEKVVDHKGPHRATLSGMVVTWDSMGEVYSSEGRGV
jgi:hypothetical protein